MHGQERLELYIRNGITEGGYEDAATMRPGVFIVSDPHTGEVYTISVARIDIPPLGV